MNGMLFGSRATIRSSIPGLALCAMTALTLCAVGCNGPQRQGVVQSVPESARDDLRMEMQQFLNFGEASVDQAATEIGRKSVSRDHQRAAVLWRTTVVARVESVAGNEDAREGLLDVWAFSQRMVNYFESGDGRSIFGEHQPVALASAKQILAAAEQLAAKFVPEDLYPKAKAQVIAFALKKPLTGDNFSQQSNKRLSDDAASESIVKKIVGIPLAPLTALQGVGQAPGSVRRVGHAMDRFTETVKSLPGDARWELQLLAMNLEESPSIVETVASMKRISLAAAQGTQALDDLPRKLREESELLLARADESQLEIRTTLGETQRTIEKFRDMTSDVDRTISSVQGASAALENAANAVTITAKEVLKFIPASKKDETGQIIGGTPRKTETSGPVDQPASPESAGLESDQDTTAQDAKPAKDTSFSFQAITESAEALGDTVGGLQQLLVDLRGMLDSDVVPEKVSALDIQLGRSLDATGLRIEGVVDHVALRAAQLMVLLFGFLIVYGWLRLKVRPARG